MRSESFARASVSSVIPIQAYEILQDKQGVSILYTVVALIGLSVTLFMPMLIERFSRRWIYTAGVLSAHASVRLLFVTDTLAGQMLGMLCARHGRQRAGDHAQPLHHGPHPQDRVHAGRIAAHGMVDAGMDRRPDARRAALHAFWHRRSACRGGVFCRGPACAVLVLQARRQRPHPPGQDKGRQSTGQYRPVLGAAEAQARLGHRLRTIVLLDHFLRLRADPDGGDRRRRPSRRTPGVGRKRASVHSGILGQGRQKISARARS